MSLIKKFLNKFYTITTILFSILPIPISKRTILIDTQIVNHKDIITYISIFYNRLKFFL